MFSRYKTRPSDNPIFCKVILVLTLMFLSACTQTTISETAQIQVECGRGPLVTAINRANEDPDPTTLVLEQGCVIEFDVSYNQDGNSSTGNALPLINTPVTIIGNNSTLTGGQGGRFFYINSQGSLRLEDLTLDHGYGLGSMDNSRPGGGAIINDGGVLTLHNVVIQNSFGTIGGAVWNSGSLITEEGTKFENNRALLGGAIFLAGSAGIPISITDTTFIRNTADINYWGEGGLGGTLYIEGTNGAGLQISDSTISGSYATYKGGVIYTADPIGETLIYDTELQGNNSGEQGGAIYLETGTMFINDTNLLGHYAGESGGSIYVQAGYLDISGSEIIGSRTDYEGGILHNQGGEVRIRGSLMTNGQTAGPPDYVHTPSFGGCISNYETLTIQNSAISHCESFAGGGLINHTLANASLTNVTMAGNKSYPEGLGGQIYNRGNLDLNFVTLVLYNIMGEHSPNLYIHGGTTRVKDSIIYFSMAYGLSINHCVIDAGSFNPVGNNYINGGNCPGFSEEEIKLLNTSTYGFYYDLEDDSPALDGASNCLDLDSNPVGFDQIGVSRPQPTNSLCDSGAIEMEFVPGPPPPTPRVMPRLSAPENLSCREGDSNDYMIAGYLMAGESAEVIGQNSAGTWLVINNPDWEGICWLFEGSVDLEGNLEGVAVMTAPPLTEPEDGNGESQPVCTGYLGAEECKKAGGTYNMQNLPPCKCP